MFPKKSKHFLCGWTGEPITASLTRLIERVKPREKIKNMASAYPFSSQRAWLCLPKTINRIMERLNSKSLPLPAEIPSLLMAGHCVFRHHQYNSTNQCVSIGYHSALHLSVLADMTGCDWLIMTVSLHNFSPFLIFPVINSSEREHKAMLFRAQRHTHTTKRNETSWCVWPKIKMWGGGAGRNLSTYLFLADVCSFFRHSAWSQLGGGGGKGRLSLFFV